MFEGWNAISKNGDGDSSIGGTGFFNNGQSRVPILRDKSSAKTLSSTYQESLQCIGKSSDKVLDKALDKDKTIGSKDSTESVGSLRRMSGLESLNTDTYNEEISDLKMKVYTKSDWVKILKNDDLENTSSTELFVSLRHGIPFEMRPRIWEFLASTYKFKKRMYAEGLYEKLASSVCRCESIIINDIHRTFPNNAFFKSSKYKGEQRLLRILRAYANLDTDVGYTQGMNFVAASLLIIMHPDHYKDVKSRYYTNYESEYEEKVFWILVHLLQDKNWRSIYKDGTPKVIEMTRYFEKLLQAQVPEIYNKIREVDLTVDIIFNEMFITIILMNAPLAIGKRILDVFFIEGEKVIFKVLLRALMLSQQQILHCEDGEKLNSYIRKKMFNELFEKYKKSLFVLFPFPEAENF